MYKKENANVPMQAYWKVIVFIIPIMFNFLPFLWSAQGYDRKFPDFWKWNIAGVIFYFLLVIFIKLFFK